VEASCGLRKLIEARKQAGSFRARRRAEGAAVCVKLARSAGERARSNAGAPALR